MILFHSSESLSGGYCEEVTDYDFIDLMEKELNSHGLYDLRHSLLELIERDNSPHSMELMSTLIGSIFLMYKHSSEDTYLSRLVKGAKKYLKGDEFNFTGNEFLVYLEPDDVVKDSWKFLAESILENNITETKDRITDSIIMLKILRNESFQGYINFISLMKTFNIKEEVIKSNLLIKYLQEKCQTLSPTN
jgi:tRNA 2-selenouridine synthase SelU